MNRRHWLSIILGVLLLIKFGWLDPISRLETAQDTYRLAANRQKQFIHQKQITQADWDNVRRVLDQPIACDQPDTAIIFSTTGYTVDLNCPE